MERFKELLVSHKKEVILLSSIILCLLGVFAFSIINNKFNAEVDLSDYEYQDTQLTIESESVLTEEPKEEVTLIRVDVKGAVNNPGVYELLENSRVIDAIREAGGLREDAFTRYLNLSKKLNDEYVILVNTLDEVERMKSENKVIEKEAPICETVSNVCVKTESLITNTEKEITKEEITFKNSQVDNETKIEEKNSSLININTATIDELMKLDGIGESKAKAIIDYRLQNGLFEKTEDIQNVSGIGEKAYEKIKDNITVSN